MDEDDLVEMFTSCEDLVVLGINDNKLILWHHPDTDEMKVLDILLYSYHLFYGKAGDKNPLH